MRIKQVWERAASLIVLSMLLATISAPGMAAEVVTLLFNERPPYLLLNKDGTASGLTGTPTAKAFQAAGITVNWSMLSTKRQVQTLMENAGLSCAIGWFYKPEREEFAKFSKPIYEDHPFVAIVGRHFSIDGNAKLSEVLANKKYRILLKEGFSYGDIDHMINRSQPNVVVSSGEVIELMQMIKGNRADLMFAAWEEAQYLVQQAGFKQGDFHILQFSDMPPGKTRHLMCSKKVSDALMQRINAAIAID